MGYLQHFGVWAEAIPGGCVKTRNCLQLEKSLLLEFRVGHPRGKGLKEHI